MTIPCTTDLITHRSTPTSILWPARLAALALALALALAAGACTDDDFGTDDAAVADAGPKETAPWPDMSPLADGIIYPSNQKMFAHSLSELFVIDPSTLQLSSVGTFNPGGSPDINDLAVTPKGELYAISVNDLYKVDPTTAKLTWITKVVGTANVALTFEVSGTLLASDKVGALRRIDPVSGAVTEIGTYGTNLGASGDLVAIKDGKLFGVNDVGTSAKTNNELLEVDPKTGAAKVIGAIGFPRVWGLAYWSGKVYGLTKTGELLAIDPKTGAGTLKNSYSYEFWGAAVTPVAPLE